MIIKKYKNPLLYAITLIFTSPSFSFPIIKETEVTSRKKPQKISYYQKIKQSPFEKKIAWIFKPTPKTQIQHQNTVNSFKINIPNINKKSIQHIIKSKNYSKINQQDNNKNVTNNNNKKYFGNTQYKLPKKKYSNTSYSYSRDIPGNTDTKKLQNNIALFFNKEKFKTQNAPDPQSTKKSLQQKIDTLQISRVEKKSRNTKYKLNNNPLNHLQVTQNTFPKKNIQSQKDISNTLQNLIKKKYQSQNIFNDPYKENIIYVMLRADLRHGTFGLPQYYPGHPQILGHLPSEKDSYDEIDAYKEYKHRPFSTVEKSWKLKNILIDDGFCYTNRLPIRSQYCKLKKSKNKALQTVAEVIYRDDEISAFEGKQAQPYCSVQKKYLYIKHYKTYYRYKTNPDLKAAAWIFKPEVDELVCKKGTPYYIIPNEIAEKLI